MIEKTSAATMVGGSVTAVISGGAEYFGLAPGEWQVIGVIGGIVIGIAGLCINSWFKWRADLRAERALALQESKA